MSRSWARAALLVCLAAGLASCALDRRPGDGRPSSASGASGDCALYALAMLPDEYDGRRPLPPLVTHYPPSAPLPERGFTMRESYSRISGLSATQLAEIAAEEARAAREGHEIECGDLIPETKGPELDLFGQPRQTRLSRPARTRDGRFAVVRVNIARGPLDAIGTECLFARTRTGWRRLRCDVLWVS